jgi:hypothetical protein
LLDAQARVIACGQKAGVPARVRSNYAAEKECGLRFGGLLAKFQALEHIQIPLRIGPLEVIQQPPTPTHHHQQPTPTGIVLTTIAQMFGQRIDPLGEQGNLHFGGACVRLRPSKPANQVLLPLFRQGHLLPRFLAFDRIKAAAFRPIGLSLPTRSPGSEKLLHKLFDSYPIQMKLRVYQFSAQA